VLKNGEKANDNKVGAKVLLITEQMPNTKPRIAPPQGPKVSLLLSRECVLWLPLLSGAVSYRSAYWPILTTIAAMSATSDIQRRSFFLFSQSNFLSAISRPGGEMHCDFTVFSSFIFAVARLWQCNAIYRLSD
jgi:hypothetical protein